MNGLSFIKRFETVDVECFNFQGKALFNPYNVGRCLEISDSNVRNYLAKMNENQAVILRNSDVRDMDFRKLNNRGEKFITKSGVYKLIFKSQTSNAEKFQDWITDEVLPSIEMTGGYIPIQEDEPNELILAHAVKIADATIKHKDEIIANQKKRIAALEVTEKDWKLLMDTKGTFCVNDIAHLVGIGEYKLFDYMRKIGLLFKNQNGDNIPYENPTNKNKFMTVPAIAPDGSAHLQTRVYPEGIPYITKLLRKYGYLEVA